MTAGAVQVGGIQIVALLDGSSPVPLSEAVTAEDGRDWNCAEHPLDAQGRLSLDLGSYLIRSGDRLALVDAGAGSVQKEGWRTGELPDSLHSVGLNFSDITDVLFTHLHWDHVGWATQKGRVMFPKATFRVHAADWEHFVTGPLAERGAVNKLTPLVDQLETFDGEMELLNGVIARPAPGHTPGSTVYLVADGGERALLLGDAVHTVAELTDPEWQSLYDLDPAAAGRIRQQFASEAMEHDDIIAAAHFPGLQFGRLVTTAEGRRLRYL